MLRYYDTHEADETDKIYNSKLTIGVKTLKVEIAKTPHAREQGLSGRKEMCPDCGLLFIFDKTDIYPYWMRRMHFDIDIIWIAEEEVVDITYGAKAPAREDFEAPRERYSSRVPIDKVLEVNAGWVEKNGIKIGDALSY